MTVDRNSGSTSLNREGRGLPADVSPPKPFPSTRLTWISLLIVAFLYVGTAFTPVIFDDNEGLYAGAVHEMHQRGDWLVPTNNGFPRVQKPPLVYWTMLVSTSLLGENEFALRLPNALATVGWIIATYLIVRRLGGERLGLAAALVLASMVGVAILFNHLVQPEPFLSCFISLGIWCLVEARYAITDSRRGKGRGSQGRRWYLLFWLFLALGTMSKGLHGALWPLGTVVLAAIFVPGLRPCLRPVASVPGIALFLLLVIPWYAYMALHFRGFLAAHFINEQIGATLNTRYPADAQQLSVAQFYLQHLLFWMPWTLFFPASLYLAGRDRYSRLAPVQRDLAGLLLCWVVLTLVSVAFSTRQDYYSMSCWGMVATGLALPWIMTPTRLPRLFVVLPCALLGLAGFLALALAAWLQPRLGSLGNATAVPIAQRNTFSDALAGISPALWGHFLPMLALFGITLLAAGTLAGFIAWRGRFFTALSILATAMAVPVGLATAGFSMMSPYFSLAENARAINRELPGHPNAGVACEALPNTASSLFYYLQTRVHWVNAPFNNQYAQQVLGEGRDYYWDEARLRQAWSGPVPLYFIIEEERLPYWTGQLPTGWHMLHQSGTRMVLTNQSL